MKNIILLIVLTTLTGCAIGPLPFHNHFRSSFYGYGSYRYGYNYYPRSIDPNEERVYDLQEQLRRQGTVLNIQALQRRIDENNFIIQRGER